MGARLASAMAAVAARGLSSSTFLWLGRKRTIRRSCRPSRRAAARQDENLPLTSGCMRITPAGCPRFREAIVTPRRPAPRPTRRNKVGTSAVSVANVNEDWREWLFVDSPAEQSQMA